MLRLLFSFLFTGDFKLAWLLLLCAYGRLPNRILARLLPLYAREGIGPKVLERYSIQFERGYYGRRGGLISSPDHLHMVFWDTRLGFTLRFDGCVVACVGFQARWGVVLIKQLQGVYRKESLLSKNLRWERLIVSVLIELMRETRTFDELQVVSAHRSGYYSVAVQTDTEMERGRRYNGTARKLGFRRLPHPDGLGDFSLRLR